MRRLSRALRRAAKLVALIMRSGDPERAARRALLAAEKRGARRARRAAAPKVERCWCGECPPAAKEDR